jgi:AcrR family transcriptional regulator
VNPKATPTRRRGADLEDALLDAAWEVLVEDGYRGFTYEAIAARAGTSRPVLYRRWPQRDLLARAAITRHWRQHPLVVPDTGSLREDALAMLRTAVVGRASLITMLSTQLLDYFRDSGTSFDELRTSFREPGAPTVFTRIVERAVARGELPGMPHPQRVVDLPFQLLQHDLVMTMRPTPEETLVEIVDDVWLPLLGVRSGPARDPSG